MAEIFKRYDFVLLFDVVDGNPNGDPDAGNLPRIDAESAHGLVTDVCIKRKVRNYIGMIKQMKQPYDIYVKEKAVLGRAHNIAFKELSINLGDEARFKIGTTLLEELEDTALPEGLMIDEDREESFLVVMSGADIHSIRAELNESEFSKEIKSFIEESIKKVKTRKPKADEVEQGKNWMCKNFYDIRTFGAVMTLKTAPNCGQVRGPVQFTFARSVDPISIIDHSITRMSVATEAEAKKQSGDNHTMGRKATVPYGLYRAHGFISAPLAKQTGFSQEDLGLLWEALMNMFDHDRSAARGMMSTRGLYIFEHDSEMGNVPAHELFDRVTIKRKDIAKPARSIADYDVHVNEENLVGVKFICKVGKHNSEL